MKRLISLCATLFLLVPSRSLSEGVVGELRLSGADTLSLGTFLDSESPRASFSLINAGGGQLKITGIRKTCGCATAETDRETLAPGATTTVSVAIAPYALDGCFSKSVFVMTDAPGAQPLRLTVTGECVPLFSVRPSKTLDAGRLPPGTKWAGFFEIGAAETAELGKPSVTSDCPASVSIKEPENQEKGHPRWRIPVSLTPPAHGRFHCSVVIPVASHTNRPPIKLDVFGIAGAELQAIPCLFSVSREGAIRPEKIRLRLEGARGRKLEPAELKVEPDSGSIALHAETEDGGGLQVCISAPAGLYGALTGKGPLALTLQVPDAAPATVTFRAAAPAKQEEMPTPLVSPSP